MTTILAAVDLNNALGYQGKLITHDPLDLHLFQTRTLGQTVIMGRKTADSLPNGTHLLNRTNYIVTSSEVDAYTDLGCIAYFPNLKKAIKHSTNKNTYIIGGQSIYQQALDSGIANKVILTRHHYEAPNADTYFPDLGPEWRLIKTIPYYALVNNKPIYTEIEFYEHTN